MMIDARKIALLARASTTSFDEAAALIQDYADAVASKAAVKATEESYNRAIAVLDRSLNAPLTLKPSERLEAMRDHVRDSFKHERV